MAAAQQGCDCKCYLGGFAGLIRRNHDDLQIINSEELLERSVGNDDHLRLIRVIGAEDTLHLELLAVDADRLAHRIGIAKKSVTYAGANHRDICGFFYITFFEEAALVEAPAVHGRILNISAIDLAIVLLAAVLNPAA